MLVYIPINYLIPRLVYFILSWNWWGIKSPAQQSREIFLNYTQNDRSLAAFEYLWSGHDSNVFNEHHILYKFRLSSSKLKIEIIRIKERIFKRKKNRERERVFLCRPTSVATPAPEKQFLINENKSHNSGLPIE